MGQQEQVHESPTFIILYMCHDVSKNVVSVRAASKFIRDPLHITWHLLCGINSLKVLNESVMSGPTNGMKLHSCLCHGSGIFTRYLFDLKQTMS